MPILRIETTARKGAGDRIGAAMITVKERLAPCPYCKKRVTIRQYQGTGDTWWFPAEHFRKCERFNNVANKAVRPTPMSRPRTRLSKVPA